MKNTHFIGGIAMSYFLLLATAFTVNGQQPNVSLSDQMDYLIAPLDFTEVTSGLLLDRGFKMMNVEDFDGSSTADTLIQYGDWFRQYGTMVTSKVTPTSPLGTTGDWKPHADSLLKAGVVPLMILHADYHKLLEDSVLLTTLITEQNGQLYDVPNRPTSPYTAHEIFSFSPKKTSENDSLSQNFRIEPRFFRSNTGKTVNSISIDFDNGAGYQTMTYNVNKKVTWSTPGKKYLTLKVVYTDNSTYYAKSLYQIINKTGAQPKSYYGAPDQVFHINHPTLSNHGATVTIEYGCGNTELRKPFIYVEGFNPEQFGNDHYYGGFYKKFDDYIGNWPTGFPMLNALDENGYDVVYIDFDRGAGDLKENAQTVREVIKELNAQKAANLSTSPNILVGYSMGGVVARLALTYMEHANETHDVSYYVSVDAPHLGANVPRGVTAALIDIYNYEYAGFAIGQDIPQVEEAYQVLNSPAAKQMLLYNGEGSNTLVTGFGPSHNAYGAHLYEQGMPNETIQNIAIAKGNGSGVGQGYGSLTPFLNVNTNTFNALGCFTNIPDIGGWLAGAFALVKLGTYARIYMDINSMAGYSTQSYRIYQRKLRVFFGFFPLAWDNHETKAQYVHYYDGVQGGTYNVSSFSGLGDSPFISNLANGSYQPCAKLHQTEFCFIPTVSALDIWPMRQTPSYPINTTQIVTNGETSFDKAFVLDPTKYPSGFPAPNNESHLDLTPSNVYPFSLVIPPDFNAVNENPTVHGYTFNFGYAEVGNNIIETTDKISHPLTVSGISAADGALWINRADNLENVNDNSNPISTSDHFTVDLKSDCAGNYGRVTVETLGAIIIGEDDTKTADIVVRDNSWIKMNDGFIEVRDGSRLIIDDGGVLRLNGGILRIQDGGEVIIKEGGKLIYEKDTQIELNGNDAVLALGGLTHIGEDATFTFIYQGAESGYIRMLEEGYEGQRFSAGLNAKVELQGANEDDLILYMEEGSDFAEFVGAVYGESYSSQKFDQVKFKDGKIIMEDQAIIILLNTSFFTRTTIESLDITHNPRGIKPLTTCYITSSTLNRMTIDAHLYYSGMGPLFIGSSEVNNSYVYVRGYGYNLQNCNFNYSKIFSYDTPMGNNILRSNFNNAGTAVEDDSDSELFVYQSNFYENGAGIAKRRGRVTAKCTNFEENNTAIIGYEASEVNISTLYNGGYNNFRDNSLNIYLWNAYELQMEDGYNEFYDGTSMNIAGNLDISMSLCAYPIKAYNNTWTPLSDTIVPYGDLNHPDMAEFQVVIGQPVGPPWAQNCPAKFSFGPVAPITICGKYDDPKDPIVIIEGPKSNGSNNDYPLLTSPTYFTDTPFDYALKVAAYTTTIADTLNGDDLLAADKYFEFLYLAEMDTLPNDSMALVIEKMRWGSLNNYKAIIERLFADSVLLRSNNQTDFDPIVQNYVTVLMAFTDSVKTAENYKQQFQLELWKAALMKTIGKKEQALHIISNINYCDHDSLQRIILLEQIQNLEFEIARTQIDISTFLSDSVTFVLDSTIYQIPLESYIDTTGFGSYIMSPNSILFSSCNTASARPSQLGLNNEGVNVVLYPNPTQNYVNISFLEGYPSPDAILTLSIFELTGKEVYSGKLPAQNARVELPNLANALYLYRLKLNDTLIDQGKLSIIE